MKIKITSNKLGAHLSYYSDQSGIYVTGQTKGSQAAGWPAFGWWGASGPVPLWCQVRQLYDSRADLVAAFWPDRGEIMRRGARGRSEIQRISTHEEFDGTCPSHAPSHANHKATKPIPVKYAKNARIALLLCWCDLTQPVDKPLVHMAEAIMVILFATWNRQTFNSNSLRPANLLSSLCWALNNTNPLDYRVSSYICSKVSKVRKDNRRRMAQKQIETSVEKKRAAIFVLQHLKWGFLIRNSNSIFVVKLSNFDGKGTF